MVDTFLFPRNGRVSRNSLLLDATIRDFSGGWNVVDNDLNLDTKFAKILQNVQRGVDGANSIRPGTELYADTSEYLDEIINCEYFSGHIVCVGKNGKLVKIDAAGNVNEIWSDDWANNLPGNPLGWDATLFASFAVFNGSLIVCNGVNKPLIISSSMNVEYLTDLATGSNTNTPIARFVVAHGRFLCMAGDFDNIDRLYISATDVGGTWLNDDAPNDAVNIDLGSRVPSGSQTIKGLGRFRDKLMVMFEDSILPGDLGVYNASNNHTPTFDDAIENVGAVSHRIVQTISDDMLFGDVNNISTVKRALFTGSTTVDAASEFIAPEYQKSLRNLNSTIALEDKVWSIWDSANTNYMLFIPDASTDEQTTEYRCLVYKRNDGLKIKAWHDWRNWKFRCGCRSSLKDIFLADGTEVFRLGSTNNEDEAVHVDYQGSQEMFDDDTPFEDYTGIYPVASVKDSGIPIRFIWELPWSDHNNRFLTKSSRYVNLDTEGDNKFTLTMFTDNIYYNTTDLGESWVEDDLNFDDSLGFDVNVLDPALTMTFEGGDSPGFGNDEFGEDFGGGRPTRLEKLYAWTSKYKLQKLRVTGDATKALKFISITMAYLNGSPRR